MISFGIFPILSVWVKFLAKYKFRVESEVVPFRRKDAASTTVIVASFLSGVIDHK